jgi:hypothetical protein
LSLENRQRVDIATLSPDWLDDLTKPLIQERDRQPRAIVIILKDYQTHQLLLEQRNYVSIREARRAASRAFLGDLVGCQVSCGEPVWVSAPQSLWQGPFRFFDGTPLTVIEVDA